MQFHSLKFQDLNSTSLYAILQLRNEIFIVEQNCPYQDMDGKDEQSIHLCGYDDNNKLIAYCRILPEGISYSNYCSIGRVAVVQESRSNNYGKLLMQTAINYCLKHYTKKIKISAQFYLKKFYTELGFVIIGDTYLEDNIPHIAMVHQ
jgi:ElaA protein